VLSSCICPSVCLSQAGIVPKRLNVESRKQRRTVAKHLSEIPVGASNTSGVYRLKSAIFEQYLAISQKRCKYLGHRLPCKHTQQTHVMCTKLVLARRPAWKRMVLFLQVRGRRGSCSSGTANTVECGARRSDGLWGQMLHCGTERRGTR